jgi:hypothetical protein
LPPFPLFPRVSPLLRILFEFGITHTHTLSFKSLIIVFGYKPKAQTPPDNVFLSLSQSFSLQHSKNLSLRHVQLRRRYERSNSTAGLPALAAPFSFADSETLLCPQSSPFLPRRSSQRLQRGLSRLRALRRVR